MNGGGGHGHGAGAADDTTPAGGTANPGGDCAEADSARSAPQSERLASQTGGDAMRGSAAAAPKRRGAPVAGWDAWRWQAGLYC
jgi:hypothetical protein